MITATAPQVSVDTLLLNVSHAIELRSATDNLKPLQEKMQEYQQLGVKLGLLVNPKNKQVEVYRLGGAVEILESSSSIDCSEVMPGFVLSMNRIW